MSAPSSPSFPDFAVTSNDSPWDPEQEQLVRNVVAPIVEYFKKTGDDPDGELAEIVKKLVALSGVTRPATPSAGGRKDKKDKKDKSKEDRDKNVRFLGECCICGLEKRGNYDRLGFLCAGCRTVPVHQIQSADATRVPRVRYSPHYVPSVLYPRRFDFLPEALHFSESMQSSFATNPSRTVTPPPGSAGQSGSIGGGMIAGSPILAVTGGPLGTNESAANDSRYGSAVLGRPLSAGSGASGSAEHPPAMARYSVFKMDVPEEHSREMMGAVDALRMLYHPSFLYNFAVSRDYKRNLIWTVHETAYPIELRGALPQGVRCYELLRQMAVAALSGLLYLKDFGRTHNDLRPENFFIDERHRVKLRLGPFPVQDLPAPFSYEHSFFSVNQTQSLIPTVSGGSFANMHTDDDISGSTPSPSASQASLSRKAMSFASKIDSYCLSRRTSRRRVEGQGSRDMFVLGVTLTLIAYGDVDMLPLPSEDDDLSSDPDELFLVEFIWRLLTGERSPDEALRDDYLTTVRLVDGAAVETIVLRIVSPPVPKEVEEHLLAISCDGPSTSAATSASAAASPKSKSDKKLTFRDVADEAKSDSRSTSQTLHMDAGSSAAKAQEGSGGDLGSKKESAASTGTTGTTTGSNSDSRSASSDPAEEKKRLLKEKMLIKARDMTEALNAASLRFRVNRWNTAVGKLVSFFNNAEVPAGEMEANAADPHLFQVVRTPTQLTFYSVRRDPRLLRARQIAGERQVASFSNALLASSSMTLAAKLPGQASATFEREHHHHHHHHRDKKEDANKDKQ